MLSLVFFCHCRCPLEFYMYTIIWFEWQDARSTDATRQQSRKCASQDKLQYSNQAIIL